jgi:hypothetical protein
MEPSKNKEHARKEKGEERNNVRVKGLERN